MLHDGATALTGYTGLIERWYTYAGKADESTFTLEGILNDSLHSDWQVTGEGLTPVERRQLMGWSTEDAEALGRGDPRMLAVYKAEVEEDSYKLRLSGADRCLWIDARLADIESAVNSKRLEARLEEIDSRLRRWERIERNRPSSEDSGLWLIWADDQSADRGPAPERTGTGWTRSPEHLPPNIKTAHLDVIELHEKAFDQFFTHDLEGDLLDVYERSVEHLICMSKARADGPGLLRWMQENERRRTEDQGRTPIPTDHGWYEYASLEIDDEGSRDQELVRASRSQSALWIRWAKELVGLLPSVVDKSAHLDSHAIAELGDKIPPSVRALFEQAHLSYIFDFEIPCTLTCGALMEEAFHVRFEEMFEGWEEEYREARKRGEKPQYLAFREMIARIVEQNPFAAPARQLAKSVWDARTEAMHKPEEYIRQKKYTAEAVLSDTRRALQILFEPEKNEEGKN